MKGIRKERGQVMNRRNKGEGRGGRRERKNRKGGIGIPRFCTKVVPLWAGFLSNF